MSDVENAQTGATAAPASNEPAQEPQQTPAPVEASTEQPEQPRDEKGRWATQRIGELTRNWRSEQRAHEQTRQEIAQMREQLARLTPKPDPQTDFNGYLQSEIDQRMQRFQAEATQRQQQETQQRQWQTLEQTFDQRLEAYAKDHPDVLSAVDALSGALPEPVLLSVADSEHGPAIIQHLANNPQELAQLQSSPPWQAVRLLGRIESKVSTPKPKPVSSAPAPTPTISGSAVAPRGLRDDLSMADWLAERNAQLAKR